MKRWMTFGLTMLLVFALSACGSKTTSNPPGTTTGGTTTGGTTTGGTTAGGAQDIKVTATNFQFSPAEIKVKKGDKVKITLQNKEGAHGFEIPDFKVNLQKDGSAEFTADKAGTHEFHCSVMCGAGHDNMVGKIIVE
ncbi:cupredoxin domain-containing protein [Paenibacillus sp. KQZ6P-2]|uniref:Cupredoxin domain-containing protein n=1 Tax=Paenibacillus mangrovi TaxID=2931978 RepID=A0A9X1WMA6_9BACL|nr:cupredoxin domain-containing protein [Paenibacillus mangrovi]MCJ8011256.1 cupredoxin domain-containing protein [Paenibacillus mangrovi]